MDGAVPIAARCTFRRGRADDTVTKALSRLLHAGLIVVDGIGLLPIGPDPAEGSTCSSTGPTRSAPSRHQRPAPRRVRRAVASQELTAAIVDRLLHRAHVRQTSGDSVRLSQALAGQRVMPLA